ncbi:MAG: glycosyltransferase family 2 protein [Propionibacteriaceae bacterium]|nr:glycosyltransferase family 2 protein [Propionibacteriaceae bacterium]
MCTVNILLATYNGESYLAEQVASIQRQTHTDWRLLIRDDGSTDGTVELVRGLAADDPRIQMVDAGAATHVGPHRGFYELVQAAPADFYVFSDQDDVWRADKLEVLLGAAKSCDPATPTMWYSDVAVVGADLTLLKPRLLNGDGHYRAMTLCRSFVGNSVGGMSSMINAALAARWRYADVGMHDSYLAMLALVLGRLVYVDEPLVQYRQHGGNAIGVARTDGAIDAVGQFWDLVEASWARVASVLAGYSDAIGARQQAQMRDFLVLSHGNPLRRLAVVARNRYRRATATQTWIARVLLVTGAGRRAARTRRRAR